MKTAVTANARRPRIGCGLTLIDALLEPLRHRREGRATDAALDLRSVLAASADTDAMLRAFFRLQDAIPDSLYPALQRLQTWFEAEVVAWVMVDEFDALRRVALALDVADYEELCAQCKAEAGGAGSLSADVEVRFDFLPSAFAVPVGTAAEYSG
jgi:hypothetical protein